MAGGPAARRRCAFWQRTGCDQAAIEHLGYVQIDTINVIERCHHHILFTRIPDYRREHLHHVQAVDKSVFEYWTHALAYVPTRDIRFFLGAMAAHRTNPERWFSSVEPKALRKVMTRIRKQGPLSIRDINDDVAVEKTHAWASRKPSKRALELAFFNGAITVSERAGMVKTYDLIDRHFGWEKRPRPATERQTLTYELDRALQAQGLMSLDSACYLKASQKPALKKLIDGRVRRGELVPLRLEDDTEPEYWATPETLDAPTAIREDLVHILSPFDPLIIQRKRLERLFGYKHLFEAYVPKSKRKLGYFALPVLIGDRIVAALDLKADRQERSLQICSWTWIEPESAEKKRLIEDALDRFSAFQFAQ